MSVRSHTRLTPEQRRARRHQLDQLRQATSALLTSEGWRRWLHTRSRFHRYSLRNTLLIAFQCPHATHVAGFRKWLELGRCVRKGEQAIRIFAPVRYHRRDDSEGTDDEAAEQLVGFKLAAVFDVSQTDPLPGVEPAPLDPPGQPVSGDSHAHLLAPLERHAASLGYTVGYEALDGRAGYCSARESRIVVDAALPGNGKVATRVHELAHAHEIDYQRFSRAEAELIVESVACIVCAGTGLDTRGESVPYLAGWNPEQALERIHCSPARSTRSHGASKPPWRWVRLLAPAAAFASVGFRLTRRADLRESSRQVPCAFGFAGLGVSRARFDCRQRSGSARTCT